MAEAGSRYLAIYPNDHLAGSTTVIELVQRAAREHQGTELGTFLSEVSAEIRADRAALEEIMARNGIAQQRIKLAAAWAAEKAGRLKSNGALLRRSPLTPLVELETLAIGIHGKERLWRLLRANPADDATAARLDELIARAQRQHEAVERQRIAAGSRAIRAARAT